MICPSAFPFNSWVFRGKVNSLSCARFDKGLKFEWFLGGDRMVKVHLSPPTNLDESALIAQATSRLQPAEERRLNRLIDRSERGILSEKEQQEYLVLAEKVQQLDGERVTALAELSRRRGQSPAEVLKEIRRLENGDGG
jgi:hypothetical protein